MGECGSLAEEVSEETNFSMFLRDYFCDILVKNVSAFCPCLKSQLEAKVRGFRLPPLQGKSQNNLV